MYLNGFTVFLVTVCLTVNCLILLSALTQNQANGNVTDCGCANDAQAYIVEHQIGAWQEHITGVASNWRAKYEILQENV